jgi:hypothetical protein
MRRRWNGKRSATPRGTTVARVVETRMRWLKSIWFSENRAKGLDGDRLRPDLHVAGREADVVTRRCVSPRDSAGPYSFSHSACSAFSSGVTATGAGVTPSVSESLPQPVTARVRAKRGRKANSDKVFFTRNSFAGRSQRHANRGTWNATNASHLGGRETMATLQGRHPTALAWDCRAHADRLGFSVPGTMSGSSQGVAKGSSMQGWSRALGRGDAPTHPTSSLLRIRGVRCGSAPPLPKNRKTLGRQPRRVLKNEPAQAGSHWKSPRSPPDVSPRLPQRQSPRPNGWGLTP